MFLISHILDFFHIWVVFELSLLSARKTMKEKSAHSKHFILMDDLALRSPGLTQQLDLSHIFLPGSSLTVPMQAPVPFARIVAIASQPSQPVHEPDEHMSLLCLSWPHIRQCFITSCMKPQLAPWLPNSFFYPLLHLPSIDPPLSHFLPVS